MVGYAKPREGREEEKKRNKRMWIRRGEKGKGGGKRGRVQDVAIEEERQMKDEAPKGQGMRRKGEAMAVWGEERKGLRREENMDGKKGGKKKLGREGDPSGAQAILC